MQAQIWFEMKKARSRRSSGYSKGSPRKDTCIRVRMSRPKFTDTFDVDVRLMAVNCFDVEEEIEPAAKRLFLVERVPYSGLGIGHRRSPYLRTA